MSSAIIHPEIRGGYRHAVAGRLPQCIFDQSLMTNSHLPAGAILSSSELNISLIPGARVIFKAAQGFPDGRADQIGPGITGGFAFAQL